MGKRFVLLLILLAACGRAPTLRPASDLVAEGWDQYRLGEFDLAVKAFQQAAKSETARVPALFGEAQTWQLRRPDFDLKKAAALYGQILEIAPKSDYAAWSLLALARIKAIVPVDQPVDIAAVQPAFQAVMDRFPDHLAGHEAFFSLQALKLQTNSAATWHEVLTALDQFLQRHPQTPYASGAHLLRAHCFHMLGEPAKELQAVRQAWQTGEANPDNPEQNQVGTEWRIATLAEFDVGDFATAREYYHRLIDEYPTEQRVFLAKQELRHMDEIEAQLRQEPAGHKGGDQ